MSGIRVELNGDYTGLKVGHCIIHLVPIIYHTEIVWKLILLKERERKREEYGGREKKKKR